MQKILITALFLFVGATLYAQTAPEKSWFAQRFNQRIQIGLYDSFGDEKANVTQAGYDAVLNLIPLKPAWYLLDVSVGAAALFVRDQIQTNTESWYGEARTTENRLIPAFELNWAVRLHVLSISRIRTSLYAEAAPMTLVVYAKPYPTGGTRVNIGTHVGFGFKSYINDELALFSTVRVFSHTSNGQPEATNPSLDMVGIVVGFQF
ncbi:MAG: acyloxyacyl hydrolase [Bacteroidales bacterium]|jgi:hypothetical protein|nr:acyloxyacyl hydrolase [Bacteroidales bacterium]